MFNLNKIIILIAILVFPVAYINAENITNSGFIAGNIWYSQDPFFAGEEVRIYTIVFNSNQDDLLGTIEFYNNDELLGTKDFSLSGGGNTQNIWIDWVATEGVHKISAKIVKPRISKVGGEETIISLENNQTGENERIVDVDTDGDRIGNTKDSDDDNDGILDIEDTKPLTFDAIPEPEEDSLIDDVAKLVKENTPEVVVEQTTNIIEKVEDLRKTGSKKTEEKIIELKKEISVINEEADKLKKDQPTTTKDQILDKESYKKPWSYIQLFFFTAFNSLLDYGAIFYTTVFGILLYIAKLIINRVYRRDYY